MGNGQARERTLGFVNRIRVTLGKKPLKRMPKGRRGSPWSCPVANAISAASGSHDIRVYGDTIDWFLPSEREKLEKAGFQFRMDPIFGSKLNSLKCPKYVGQFVKEFDLEKYPDLLKKAA